MPEFAIKREFVRQRRWSLAYVAALSAVATCWVALGRSDPAPADEEPTTQTPVRPETGSSTPSKAPPVTPASPGTSTPLTTATQPGDTLVARTEHKATPTPPPAPTTFRDSGHKGAPSKASDTNNAVLVDLVQAQASEPIGVTAPIYSYSQAADLRDQIGDARAILEALRPIFQPSSHER